MREVFKIMNKGIWREDDERSIRYYTALIERYGVDVRAVDWGSRESQVIRFSVLAQVGQLNGASVLDVGCGMGDLFGWLKRVGMELKYTGIDITPKMIEIAQQRFPEAQFELKNPLDVEDSEAERYDFVLQSGILTHRQDSPFLFLKVMVEKMFLLCSRAVAFNSLSSWASDKERGEFYADPLETVAFCRTLTPWVVLRHDYHPRDFTIYMYKRQNS